MIKLPWCSSFNSIESTPTFQSTLNYSDCVCSKCTTRILLVKALVNEDTLLRTHCCPWCFLGCANWETFVADTKCFWTKSETFFVSRTQNLCPQQMLRPRTNGKTFVSATMCPQQCVLVCQGLYWLDVNSIESETCLFVVEYVFETFASSEYCSYWVVVRFELIS